VQTYATVLLYLLLERICFYSILFCSILFYSILSYAMLCHAIEQSHRIIEVGEDLQDHQVQPSIQHHHAY